MRFAAILLAVSALAAQSASLTQAQSDEFHRKLQTIVAHGSMQSKAVRRTRVTQNEVNSYLKFKRAELLPVGVTDAMVRAEGPGRLSGRAIVDLDVLREKNSTGGLFDPRSYLTGSLPLTASGTLHTKDGAGRFELESAAVSGIPIPKSFLQEIVSYYTRSNDHPNGVNIDQVFELPANIKEIQVGQGNAIVVQ